jgi:hypothetical protein
MVENLGSPEDKRKLPDLVKLSQNLLEEQPFHPGSGYNEIWIPLRRWWSFGAIALNKPLHERRLELDAQTGSTSDNLEADLQHAREIMRTGLVRSRLERQYTYKILLNGYRPAKLEDGKVIPLEEANEQLYSVSSTVSDMEERFWYPQEKIIYSADGIMEHEISDRLLKSAIEQGVTEIADPSINIRYTDIELDPVQRIANLLQQIK